MPDDPKPGDEKKDEPSILDPKTLQPMIADAVKTAIAAERDVAVREAQRIAAEDAARTTQTTRDAAPLRKVLLDEIGPDLARINLNAQAAADLGKFYALHPEAKEFSTDIEAKFGELMAVGRPQDRESIWHWYRGANFDKFAARAAEQTKKEQDAAADASTLVGVGAPGVRGGTPIDPWAMSPDDLDKAMKDRAF